MIDIAVKGIVKAFEVDKNILDGLTFDINEGEHVGLLGKNGAGKTTLFNIIVGEIEADEGEVVLGTSKKTGLISQIPVYPEAFTTEDVLKTAHRRQYDIKAEMERLERLMSESAQVEAGTYDKLALEFDMLDGYEIEYERNKVANGLDISPAMRAQLFSSLSGGEKTRVNLARLILEKTDILLLDEPTNHLDMRSTEWLEDYLQKFKGTVLIISHDRYFLDKAVTRIIEVRNGKAEFYSGNYSFYAEEKQARYEEHLKRYEQQEKEAKRLGEAADRLYQWGTGNKKLMRKSFAIKKRIEKLRQLDKPEKEKQIHSSFSEKDFHSDELVTIKNLSKSFSDKVLFHDVELNAGGGERIALLGDNGTGKTTFLHILLGMEPCDKGLVKIGPAVKCAYLPQVVHFQRPELTVLDTLMAETGLTPQSARNRLGAFKFSGEDVFKQVSILSGGEKSRLRLCILMGESINLLVLDEPTNHLDIDSREWIEGALEDYEEALLFVSHDRYFVDRFATRIWALENGTISDYPCDFEAYRKLKERLLKKEQRQKEQKRKTKLRTVRPDKEAVSIEKQILAIEEKQKDLALQIEENATDYIALSELFEERERLESELLNLYDSWEEQVNAHEQEGT